MPFLSGRALIRPFDEPYSERYLTHLEARIKERAKKLQATEEKGETLNHTQSQEKQELSHSVEQVCTPNGAETGARNVPTRIDHESGENHGQQERVVNNIVPKVYGVDPNANEHLWPTSHRANNQGSTQETAGFTSKGVQARAIEDLRPWLFSLEPRNLQNELGTREDRRTVRIDMKKLSGGHPWSQATRTDLVSSASDSPRKLVCPTCHRGVGSQSDLKCDPPTSLTREKLTGFNLQEA